MSAPLTDLERLAEYVANDGIACSHQSLGSYRRALLKVIRAAVLAQPEADGWRRASDPPQTTRSVLVWLRFGDGVASFGKTLGGPSGFAFQNGAITHWRDVTPPEDDRP